MFYYLSIITTITGMFTLLDLFVEKRAKGKVAEYVFGFGTANLAGFEHSVITSLLSLITTNGRVSFKRVLFRYSAVISSLIALMAFLGAYVFRLDFFSENPSPPLRGLLEALWLMLMMIVMFWPFDCWSLWVTHKIFKGNASKSLLAFIGRILLDIFVTVLPLIILLFLAFSFVRAFPNYLTNFDNIDSFSDINGADDLMTILTVSVFVVTLLNIAGSLLITAVQVFTLLFGVLSRSVLRLTKLNQHLAMVSSAPDFPFTFIGLLCGISVAGMTMVLT